MTTDKQIKKLYDTFINEQVLEEKLNRKTQELSNLSKLIRDTKEYKRVIANCADDCQAFRQGYSYGIESYSQNEVECETLNNIINQNTALQKQVDELNQRLITLDGEMLTVEITLDEDKERRNLLSQNKKLIEALEEMANKTCETGCRFDDKDCTPENCIIREWKDLASQTLQAVRENKQ